MKDDQDGRPDESISASTRYGAFGKTRFGLESWDSGVWGFGRLCGWVGGWVGGDLYLD